MNEGNGQRSSLSIRPLCDFTKGMGNLSKNTALFDPVADSLTFTNHQWRPFSAESQNVCGLPFTTRGQVCVNTTLNGICATKHGRGIANSHTQLWEKYPRGWARFSGNAPSVEALSVVGFGSCPADGTLKLLTKAQERKGSPCSQ